jgi:hypothetical protein
MVPKPVEKKYRDDVALVRTYKQSYDKLAYNDQKVMHAGVQIQICKLTDDQLKQGIAMLVKYIKTDVGLKAQVSDYDLSRFTTYMREYYSHLSINEIKLAFEFALVGMLDEYLPKRKDGTADISHYGEFSADYYTKIIKAYIQRKVTTVKRAERLSIEEHVGVSAEEQKEFDRKHVERVYEQFDRYCSGKDVDFLLPFLVIKDLIDSGLMNKRLKYKSRHYIKACEDHKGRQYGSITKNIGYDDKVAGYAQRISDIEAICMVFENLKSERKDIREYVKI